MLSSVQGDSREFYTTSTQKTLDVGVDAEFPSTNVSLPSVLVFSARYNFIFCSLCVNSYIIVVISSSTLVQQGSFW